MWKVLALTLLLLVACGGKIVPESAETDASIAPEADIITGAASATIDGGVR